ncbi:MAG: prolipoprotein diacylglyceryl transferase [bacterium]
MYPFLFKIGSQNIYTKEFLLFLAFVIGIFLAVKRGRRFGISPKILIKLGILLFLASVIGGRLLYVFQNLDWYIAHPSEILFSKSGFTFYGGFLLSFIISILYLQKKRLSFLLLADIFAPSLALSEAIGRMGCFFGGCCYGKPTSLPWGISFPEGSLPHQHFGSLPLHPTQLYLALASFFIFLVIRRIKPDKGKGFFLYLTLHSIFRFIIEFVRGDTPYIFLNLNFSQITAFFIGLIGLVFLIRH